jgi:hypothetical protein
MSSDVRDGSSITGFYVTGSSFQARPTLSPPSETPSCLSRTCSCTIVGRIRQFPGFRLSAPSYDTRAASDCPYTHLRRSRPTFSWPTRTTRFTDNHRHDTTGPLKWRNAWMTSSVAVSRRPLGPGGPSLCLTPIQQTRQNLS